MSILGALERLEEILEDRAAFIGGNRYALAVLLGFHASGLLRRGAATICVEDLWGLRPEPLRAGGLSEKDLERILRGCGRPHLIYSPWSGLSGGRDLLADSLGIYTDGGRHALPSRGFRTVVLIQVGLGDYLADTGGGEGFYIHIDSGGVGEPRLPAKLVEAHRIIVRSFRAFGPFRMIDAINILSREMGLDRAEARKIVSSLASMGALEAHEGYLQPSGVIEGSGP